MDVSKFYYLLWQLQLEHIVDETPYLCDAMRGCKQFRDADPGDKIEYLNDEEKPERHPSELAKDVPIGFLSLWIIVGWVSTALFVNRVIG